MSKNKQQLQGRFWLAAGNGEYFAGKGRIELLRHIKETGSISKAAKVMGMSYKAAWDSVDTMNNLAGEVLVHRTSGGRHGGGSMLTDAGIKFIETYEKYDEIFNSMLDFIAEHPEVENMAGRFHFKTSADNSFYGKISEIKDGAVMSIVSIDCGGIIIYSSVSKHSIDRMGLKKGTEVCAVINSNQLIILDDEDNNDKLSAANIFSGTVTSVKKGAVNGEVFIKLSDTSSLYVIVTNESVDTMGIKYGRNLKAACSSASVIVIN